MIYWRLSARENLRYFGTMYGVEKKTLEHRIDELLEMVQLTERSNDPVETYSKGMKQRLQIARGLINNPEYVFMDEPTIGLDAMITRDLHTQIKRLAKEEGKGILLTSHYLSEVEELCDYIYVLNNGELVNQGTARELSQSVFKKHLVELDVRGNVDFTRTLLQELKPIDATVEVESTECGIRISSTENVVPDLAKMILSHGIEITKLQEIEPSLEDTILEMSKQLKDE